ncbi:hypothetical protein DHEL01_v212359 [Diaporthe helianthi]|uniref:Geranylgeranyl pyrophosphate synthetase n=1 Tax=Diaporthe helianthi TaxID=158607 RepID=A0A2P5HG65_DIAHE|nr:hypothetical protein DHEL01_v212359 [Diaporthe helianthi]
MLPSLARKSLRRRLRHAGFDTGAFGHIEKKKRWLVRNLGEKIGRVQVGSLKPCADQVTSASGFELLCSYSWRVETKKLPMTLPQANAERRSLGPRIYVPGEAPVVAQRNLPLVVGRRSTTKHYRDANIARMPSYPFEPMFQSMSVLNPGFRFDKIDLIVNRNSLRHLLRFTGGSVQENFRLDLAMIHNTLVVTPVLESVLDQGAGRGNFGRDFEDLIVRRSLRDSGSYHRAIRYNLGPLNCAVLSELDAALEDSGEALTSDDKRWMLHPNPVSVPPSELSGAFQPDDRAEKVLFGVRNRILVNKAKLWHEPRSEMALGGNGTLSKDAAELYAGRERGYRKMPQMWLGRIPFLVHGKYTGRCFTRVDVVRFATSFAAYETQIQDRLQKLVSLLETLRKLATDAAEQRCIVICNKAVKPRELRVFNHQKTPPSPLPADIRRHFWTNQETRKQDAV